MGENIYEQCAGRPNTLSGHDKEFDDVFDAPSSGKTPPESGGSGEGEDDGDNLK